MSQSDEYGFQKTSRGNFVKNYNGFYISYNGNIEETCEKARGSWSDILGRTTMLMADLSDIDYNSDDDSAETALCYDGKFYILNGDFRKEYCISADQGGLDECIKLYDSLKDRFRSSWSDDNKDLESE